MSVCNRGAAIHFECDHVSAQLQKNAINAAIQFWQNNLCVTFALNASPNGGNGLNFTKAGGCWSYIGLTGGWQPVSIDNGCETVGTVTISAIG
jgi:hypothetical protein